MFGETRYMASMAKEDKRELARRRSFSGTGSFSGSGSGSGSYTDYSDDTEGDFLARADSSHDRSVVDELQMAVDMTNSDPEDMKTWILENFKKVEDYEEAVVVLEGIFKDCLRGYATGGQNHSLRTMLCILKMYLEDYEQEAAKFNIKLSKEKGEGIFETTLAEHEENVYQMIRKQNKLLEERTAEVQKCRVERDRLEQEVLAAMSEITQLKAQNRGTALAGQFEDSIFINEEDFMNDLNRQTALSDSMCSSFHEQKEEERQKNDILSRRLGKFVKERVAVEEKCIRDVQKCKQQAEINKSLHQVVRNMLELTIEPRDPNPVDCKVAVAGWTMMMDEALYDKADEIYRIKEQTKSINEELEAKRDEYQTLRAQLGDLEKQIDTMDKQYQAFEREAIELENKKLKMQDHVETLSRQQQCLQEQVGPLPPSPQQQPAQARQGSPERCLSPPIARRASPERALSPPRARRRFQERSPSPMAAYLDSSSFGSPERMRKGSPSRSFSMNADDLLGSDSDGSTLMDSQLHGSSGSSTLSSSRIIDSPINSPVAEAALFTSPSEGLSGSNSNVHTSTPYPYDSVTNRIVLGTGFDMSTKVQGEEKDVDQKARVVSNLPGSKEKRMIDAPVIFGFTTLLKPQTPILGVSRVPDSVANRVANMVIPVASDNHTMSMLLTSPNRTKPLKLNIDVCPNSLQPSESGDCLDCEFKLSMEDGPTNITNAISAASPTRGYYPTPKRKLPYLRGKNLFGSTRDRSPDKPRERLNRTIEWEDYSHDAPFPSESPSRSPENAYMFRRAWTPSPNTPTSRSSLSSTPFHGKREDYFPSEPSSRAMSLSSYHSRQSRANSPPLFESVQSAPSRFPIPKGRTPPLASSGSPEEAFINRPWDPETPSPQALYSPGNSSGAVINRPWTPETPSPQAGMAVINRPWDPDTPSDGSQSSFEEPMSPMAKWYRDNPAYAPRRPPLNKSFSPSMRTPKTKPRNYESVQSAPMRFPGFIERASPQQDSPGSPDQAFINRSWDPETPSPRSVYSPGSPGEAFINRPWDPETPSPRSEYSPGSYEGDYSDNESPRTFLSSSYDELPITPSEKRDYPSTPLNIYQRGLLRKRNLFGSKLDRRPRTPPSNQSIEWEGSPGDDAFISRPWDPETPSPNVLYPSNAGAFNALWNPDTPSMKESMGFEAAGENLHLNKSFSPSMRSPRNKPPPHDSVQSGPSRF